MNAPKIEIVKALCVLKKEASQASEIAKSINIRSIVNVMKAIGIFVEETETEETIERGCNSNGNPTKRVSKTGKGYKFQLGEQVFEYNSLQKFAAYNLTCKLSTMNIIEISKSF